MVYLTRLSNWVGIIAISSFAGTSATSFDSKLVGGIVAVSTFGGLVVILITSSYVMACRQRVREERERIASEKAPKEEQRRRQQFTKERQHEIVEELKDIRRQLLASKDESRLRELNRRTILLRDSISSGSDVQQEIDEVLNLIGESLGFAHVGPVMPTMRRLLPRVPPRDLIVAGVGGWVFTLLRVGVSLAVGVSLGFLLKWLL